MKSLKHFLLLVSLLFAVAAMTEQAWTAEVPISIYLPFVVKSWPLPPSPGRLVISEVMYDPVGDEKVMEWIEIYNAGGMDLVIENYKIGDEETQGDQEGMFRFPLGSKVSSGIVIVIANQALAFQDSFGFSPDFEFQESDPAVPNLAKYTPWSGGNILLSNSGDEVLILNDHDQVIDAVSWGSSEFAFRPGVALGREGQSIERFPSDKDTDTALDWRRQSNPSPGIAVLAEPTPTSTYTLIPTPSLTTTPTPTTVPSNTPTLTVTLEPTATSTPTVKNSVTPSPSPTSTVTNTPTPTSINMPSPTYTPFPSATATQAGEPPGLLISEILYDSTCSTDVNCEWVEIYNAGDVTLTLTGFKVGDEETNGGTEGMLMFPDGTTIAAHEVLVIANKAVDFKIMHGFAPTFEMYGDDPDVPNLIRYASWGSGSVQFNNDGDEVLLLDPSDNILDSLSWGGSVVFMNPPAPDVAAGHSLERYPANRDTDTAADWIDQSQPVPGQVSIQ